jgi:hypothetical protein
MLRKGTEPDRSRAFAFSKIRETYYILMNSADTRKQIRAANMAVRIS